MRNEPHRQLILLRHAKSDWSHDVPDLERPIGARGRRQATEAGMWLAAHATPVDLVITSPAERARSTWRVAAKAFEQQPPVVVDDRLHTWSADDLNTVTQELDARVRRVVLVAHDPALSDFLTHLSGSPHEMVTSCIAILGVPTAWADVGARRLPVLAFGRPPGQASVELVGR